ncbi:DUF1330 domain-containing protein [Streptomyces qinglanensis]|uniref:Uncharacterized conserved protein, DUF1330 family n=1 Tax=Streptomyces qinglanensis TaxID=943816 RepID=A0A1H9V8I7_9ACTN|nr:DUF1330 domain-containing protein [Streptomyces qinglanensis]SES18086.1 Uncharacterized conserved protein, DUF1330 family [Streptomyces qinglanensis]
MTAYAIARLRNREIHTDLVTYVERIQASLDPYQGRFLVHGGAPEVVEGSWAGGVAVIEFPDRETVRAWYDSPEYQELLPLRTAHIDGDVIIAQGVGDDYDPASMAAAFHRAMAQES